ncbi:ABC transporter permease [Candidatus Dependentiae bacterium]|nr:ABC transporter permease [Candidatus Dependentiae bacterium]
MIKIIRKVFIFFWKDLKNLFSYKLGSVLYAFSIFIPLIIFYFLSQLVGDEALPYISKYSLEYFPFVLVGLAFSNYFIFGINSLSASIRNEQMMGTLEAMLSTPTSIPTIIFSSVIFDFVLTSLQIFLYILFGKYIFNADIHFHKIIPMMLMLFFTITSFGTFGIISASFIIVFKRGNPLALLITQSSILFGGVYFPFEMLPGWVQLFSKCLPMTYSLRGMRLLLLQNAPFSEILPDLLFLVIFTMIFLPISIYIFKFSVNKAKKDGTLIQY